MMPGHSHRSKTDSAYEMQHAWGGGDVSAFALSVLCKHGLVLRRSAQCGRYIVAGKAFSAGEVVLETQPYAFVIHSQYRESRCSYCFSQRGGPTAPRLFNCSACKYEKYCGPACQAAAWSKYHKYECAKIKAAPQIEYFLPSCVRDEVDLACRILCLKKGRKITPELSAEEVSYTDFENLESHIEDIRNNAEHDEGNTKVAQLVLQRLRGLFPLNEIKTLLGRMQCNDFSIWDDIIVSIGAGVYPAGAMINHYCNANCVVSYNTKTKTQTFRAIRNINPGEEIAHSYLDVASTTADRRGKLLKQYYFQCHCDLCSNGDTRDRMLTETTNPDPGRAEQAEQLYSEGTDLTKDANECEELLRKCLTIREGIFGPWNLQLMSTRCHMLTVLMEQNKPPEECITLCQKIIETYQRVYPPNYPMIGLQYYTLGDLFAQLGNKQEARAAHTQALQILQLTHGPDSDFISTLRQLLA
ncbi:zinc finger family protein [Pelomyxa schiedti]|nr:zinc finger family protein [Pelomyxa schiedti]